MEYVYYAPPPVFFAYVQSSVVQITKLPLIKNTQLQILYKRDFFSKFINTSPEMTVKLS